MKNMMMGIGAALLIVGVWIGVMAKGKHEPEQEPVCNLPVSSAAFADGAMIPQRYTGRGADLSPPIELGKVDPKARSIALIMDDPDVPFGVFTHWVVWNIPADTARIPEGLPKTKNLAVLGNARQGRNGYWAVGYRGPKPPRGIGIHRYRYKVYVLDTLLHLRGNPGKHALLQAMQGHLLQYGVLTGRFESR